VVYRGADDAHVSSAEPDTLGDRKWADEFRDPELQDLTRAQQWPSVNLGKTGTSADLGSGVGNGLPSGSLAAGTFNFSAPWTPIFQGCHTHTDSPANVVPAGLIWWNPIIATLLVYTGAAMGIASREGGGLSSIAGISHPWFIAEGGNQWKIGRMHTCRQLCLRKIASAKHTAFSNLLPSAMPPRYSSCFSFSLRERSTILNPSR
jgi:hypothetical protein